MNSTAIYTVLEQHAQSVHHLKRYIKFITACQAANVGVDGYMERHHICPSSIFPEYRNFRLNPWNEAVLTPRQHLICHWMLAKAFNTRGMWYAMKILLSASNKRQLGRYKSSTALAIARENHAKTLSKHLRQVNPETGLTYGQERAQLVDQDTPRDSLNGMSIRQFKSFCVSGDNNPAKGEASREKLSVAMKEHYKDKPGTFLGKTHTDEAKQKQSEAKLGDNNSTTGTVWANNGVEQLRVPADNIPDGYTVGRLSLKRVKVFEEITCPHCNKTGKGGGMNRYHFDNCKQKGAVTLLVA